MAFAETIGLASIIPFMALVGDMSLLQKENLVASIYQNSGIESETKFIFLLGVGVLFMLFISAMISMYTTWKLSMFAIKVGTEIADRLYTHYLKQDWLFHAAGSSAQLTKQISNETTRITSLILLPLMQMNARIALAVFMGIAFFTYDPKIAIIGLMIFGFAYFILYKTVRKYLQRNGTVISNVLKKRFRLMNEGFGGIKDVLLLGRETDFIKRFNQTGHVLAYSQGTNTALAQVPRYFMELISFGAMIALVLYLITSHNGNLGTVLPLLSVYALAGLKLLPAFQQIYSSLALVKGNIAAFESIQQDLKCSMTFTEKKHDNYENVKKYFRIKKIITIENITFTYPGKIKPTLNELNINIPVNSVIGIVGQSGSGKSTLIDIILGLIIPQQGKIKIDNEIISVDNRRAWQNTIGFVPQNIFLSEGSLADNIAFGIPEADIDLEKVNKTISLTHMDEFVQSLENGIHTTVGERGMQLSGGQRQRIGIARALYHDAEVLVFDEATSALDGITEKLIMEAIHDFRNKKTIIMIAHRIKTVQKCDLIYFIDDGRVVGQGTYKELINSNESFRKLAMLA